MGDFDPQTLIVWGFSLAGFISVVAVGLPFIQRDQRSSRLKAVSKARDELSRQQLENLSRTSSARHQTRQGAHIDLMKGLLARLNLEDVLSSKVLKEQLSQAGFRGQAVLATYVFFHVAAALGGAILALFIITMWEDFPYPFFAKIIIVILGAVAGFYLPKILVANMAQKRQQQMTSTFPDALDLLVICVESGLGIESAFNRVTEEIAENAPILAQEFGLTTAELAYLGDRSKAYANFAIRTGLPAAKSLSTTLIQSEKYGTPVGVALKILSKEKREERMNIAEKKGAALPALLTVPMIVFFLPLLFMVVIGPAAIQIMQM